MGVWMKLVKGSGSGDSECLPPLPSRLLTEDDLKAFYEAMKISDVPRQAVASNGGMKRKSDYLGGLDTRQYGRGKRAREVRSYEEQLTEEEFEKLCQVESPESPQVKDEITEKKLPTVMSDTTMLTGETHAAQLPQLPPNPIVEPAMVHSKEVTPPSKRGRGRPRRTPTTTELSPSPGVHQLSSGVEQISAVAIVENVPLSQVVPAPDLLPAFTPGNRISGTVQQIGIGTVPGTQSASVPAVAPDTQSASVPAVAPLLQPTAFPGPSLPVRGRGRGRKAQSGGEAPRRRGKRQSPAVVVAPSTLIGVSNSDFETKGEPASNSSGVRKPDHVSQLSNVLEPTEKSNSVSHIPALPSSASVISDSGSRDVPVVNQSMPTASDAFCGSLGSQEVSAPKQFMLPTYDVLSCSSVTTGGSNSSIMPAPVPAVNQDPIIMSAPCPNPVPSPPSVAPGAPSTTLNDSSAPKQGRGRGRKAQSGVEAPRLRGKRQNPEAPAIFEVSTDQNPKSVEVPEKKPRVNAGRRPTRRNKLENDVPKQANVLQSVASQGNTDPAITQVSDSKPEDEAGKPTNTILLDDASKCLANLVVQSAFEDKQDVAQKSTNGVQAGASQSIETTVVQGDKFHDEDEAQKHTDSILEKMSEDINCLPDGQIRDDKSGSEARGQMNIVDSDLSKVLAESAALEDSTAERKHDTRNPKELKQLDPFVGIKDSSFTSTPENWHEKEAQKQMHLVQSNPSSIMPDIAPTTAGELKQVDVTSKTTIEVESDTSQSISDHSRGKTEKSEAALQTNSDRMDMMDSTQCVADPSVDPSVLGENKDLLQSDAHILSDRIDSDTPQTMPDPSVAEVQEADRANEAEKETDDKLDMYSVISESVPELVHADYKESDAEVLKGVVEPGTPSNIVDTSVAKVQDVEQEIEGQKETDVQSDMIVVISGSFAVSELADDRGSDTDILKDIMESDAPKIIADPSVSEIGDVDLKTDAENETEVQLDATAIISETVPMVENKYDGGSDDRALNIVMESNTPHGSGDPSASEGQNIDQENEAQKDTDVQSDRTAIISGTVPMVEYKDNGGSDDRALKEPNTPHGNGDPLASEVQNIDQENKAQKDTDVQSDRTAIISGTDLNVEQGVVKFKSEASDEVVDAFGKEKSSYPGIHSTLPTLSTPVSDILHGVIHDTARNEEPASKEPFPGAACVSTLPTKEHAIGASNVALRDFNNISIEETTEIESKETAASDFFTSRHQLLANNPSPEDSCSALAVVLSATEASASSVCEPENQSEEKHVEGKCVVDGALFSDSELTENINIDEKCGDESDLPISSKSGILSPKEQSYGGEASAAVSSYISVMRVETELIENITGEDEDGTKEVEQKDNIDGTETSELMDEGAAGPDPELLEVSQCDETAAEKHENQENVPRQDSVSVLCMDENVAPVPEHSPYKLEDLLEKGDADDSDSKATGFNEVSVLKQLTVTESSQEMLSPTLRTMEQVVQQSDTTSKTENKAWEVHADQQKNIDPSMESLVQNLEVTEVSSGKVDAEELSNENDLVSAHDLADSQRLGEMTPASCSTLKIEALSAVSVNEEVQIQEVELTPEVSPAPGDCETVTNSSSGVSDVFAESQQDVDEKTSSPLQILNIDVAHNGGRERSVFQHTDDVTEVLQNRCTELVSNADPTCESFEVLEETTISNAETNEMVPIANDEISENKLDAEENTLSNAEATAESLKVLEETTVSNAEATAESLKVLEESTVSNAKINETRGSPNDGELGNKVDMQLVEENPIVDVCREVPLSAEQTVSLKDTMPGMAGVGCDPGNDDLEKTESSDHILQKESFARVDVTSAQSSDEMASSDLVPEMMIRNSDVPNAEVIEDGNALNAAEFCDNTTNCAGNLLYTTGDSGRSFGEEASSSLQTACLDVAPADVLGEKSETMQKGFVDDVQGSKEVESEKIVASDPEVHEAQPIVNAGSSQDKNGLQQLVEQYSDAATDMEVSVADSLTVDLRNESSVDDSLKGSQIHGTSALPAGAEVCSCPAENEKEDTQQQ